MLGFSIVFAVLGVLLNSVLAHTAYAIQQWLSRIGGIFIIFFGLYLLGLFKIPFLEYDHKLTIRFKFRSRYLTSFFFGFAFAAGWTPCVGPVLGGILGLAASAPSQAFSLLLSYAIGLGIPFLVVGLFVAQSSRFINRFLLHIQWVHPVFGAILIALGILVFTQELSLLANFGLLNTLLLK